MKAKHKLAEVAGRYHNLTAPLGYASDREKLECREELRTVLTRFYAQEGPWDLGRRAKHGTVLTFHKRDGRCPDDCELGVEFGFTFLPEV